MEKPDFQLVADRLMIPAQWLDNLIQFESAWNPQAKNKNSSARGLIQFIDTTAQTLGFASSLDLVSKYPDINSQLTGPVYRYLQQYAPFPDEKSLYLSVFYPAWRFKPDDTAFPDSVRAVNPGIDTVGDYVSKVRGGLSKKINFALVLAAGAAIIFLLSKIKP